MYYLTEFLSGGLITVLFSYAASFYMNHPEYIKMIAFLWGMPILYFYILFISLSIDENAAIAITYHAIIGMFCSFLIMISSLYLLLKHYKFNNSSYFIVYLNIFYLMLVIGIYMWFKLYNL